MVNYLKIVTSREWSDLPREAKKIIDVTPHVLPMINGKEVCFTKK
ncbi:MAG: hypothetical protein ACXADY_13035 [Candidatus Hodarchaeales archaeon]|jgi:hypothetical protein